MKDAAKNIVQVFIDHQFADDKFMAEKYTVMSNLANAVHGKKSRSWSYYH